MSKTLDGRVAVVTGASAGIGLAVAEELVASGARVVINARRAERLDELARRLGPGAAPVAGDCADEGVIARMLDTAKQRFGAEVDLIVINAGRGLGGTAITSDAGQWEDMIRTNFVAASRMIRAAGPRLLAMHGEVSHTGAGTGWLKRGRDLILVGSVVGRHVSPFSSFYSATKAAVQSLAEGTRRELGPKGIRVTLIEPAFVTSEFQAVAGYKDEWYRQMVEKFGPMLEPGDVARLIRFVAEQPAHVHLSDGLIRPTRQEYP